MTAAILTVSILASMEAYIQDVPPLSNCPGTEAYEAGQASANEHAPHKEAIYSGMSIIGLTMSMMPEGDMPPPILLRQVPTQDQPCYAAGYMKRSIANERRNALIGAGISTALWASLAIFASSESP